MNLFINCLQFSNIHQLYLQDENNVMLLATDNKKKIWDLYNDLIEGLLKWQEENILSI